MAGWHRLGLAALALTAITLTGALAAAPAAAQTTPAETARIPVDPPALTFGVSPDHEAPPDSGRQIVKYLVDFIPVEGMGRAREVDLGRPVAQDGVIRVSLPELKLRPGRYLASVRAVSAQGSSVSETVGPFQIGNPKRPTPDVAPAPSAAPPPPEEEQRRRGKRGFWKKMYDAIVG